MTTSPDEPREIIDPRAFAHLRDRPATVPVRFGEAEAGGELIPGAEATVTADDQGLVVNVDLGQAVFVGGASPVSFRLPLAEPDPDLIRGIERVTGEKFTAPWWVPGSDWEETREGLPPPGREGDGDD